jgi:hypothetical protein
LPFFDLKNLPNLTGYGGNIAYLLIPNQNGGPPLIIPVVFFYLNK